MKQQEKRNYGIDVLRMFSMFLVVLLHVVLQGGAVISVPGNENTFKILHFLEICSYCCVDCYGLISGYVGVNSKYRPGRFLELWLQVFLYQVLITGCFAIFAPQLITRTNLLQMVFPVSCYAYWYFSAYAGLFVVMPLLNKLINMMDDIGLKRMSVILFTVFSLGTAFPRIKGFDFLELNGGYSFVWLVILYLLGAALRRGKWERRPTWNYLLCYFSMAVISWFGGKIFIDYTAPTILLCAICLFRIFEDLPIRNIKTKKIISITSPLSFSIYIIHVQPLVWQYVVAGKFSDYCNLPPLQAVLASVLSALGVCIGCGVIDLLRLKIFQFLRVREHSDQIMDCCAKFLQEKFFVKKEESK